MNSLREPQGIDAYMVYLNSAHQFFPPDNPDQDNKEIDLLFLNKSQPIKINKATLKELRNNKAILNLLESSSHHIAKDRECFVSVIQFLDRIVPIKSSLKEVDTNYVPVLLALRGWTRGGSNMSPNTRQFGASGLQINPVCSSPHEHTVRLIRHALQTLSAHLAKPRKC